MGILKNKIIRQFHSNVFRGEIIKSAGILSSQKIPSMPPFGEPWLSAYIGCALFHVESHLNCEYIQHEFYET